MVSIRPRTDKDLDTCVAALRHVHQTEGYPRGVDDFKLFLADGRIRQAWVAELDGIIIGHIAVSEGTERDLSVATFRKRHPDESSIAVLSRLFVAPGARNAGAAARLIDTAVASSTKDGTRLLLFVLIANQAAIRLYERLGWVRYGADYFHWGDEQEQKMEAICFASPLPD